MKEQAFQVCGLDKEVYAKALGVDKDKEPGVYEFLLRALDYPLPEPWTEHVDKKRRVFYWNPASRHSSWQHPLASTHKALINAYRRVMSCRDREAAVVAEVDAFHKQGEEELATWRESKAPDGSAYYYKVGTEITRWDNPRDQLVTHMELRVRMLSELIQRSVDDEQELGDESTLLPADTLSQQVDESVLGPEEHQGTTSTAIQMPKELADLSQTVNSGAVVPAGGGVGEITLPQEDKRRVSQRSRPSALDDSSFHSTGGGPAGGRDSSAGGRHAVFLSDESSVGANTSVSGDTSRLSSTTTGRRAVFGEEGAGIGAKTSVSGDSSRLSSTTAGNPKQSKRGKRRNKDKNKGPSSAQKVAAANMINKAAKNFLSYKRVKRWEAATDLQTQVRGFLVRLRMKKEMDAEKEAVATIFRRPQNRQLLRDIGAADVPALTDDENRQVKKNIAEASAELVKVGSGRPILSPAAHKAPGFETAVVPEELALYLGVNFADPQDNAAFSILRPILDRPVPAPWQVLKQPSGKVIFFHPGVGETRKQHPMFSFYRELFDFLRAQARNSVPITEPLAHAVFKEASPSEVRMRLGVWQGPYEDRADGRYVRLMPGQDDFCAQNDNRRDDPRLEAASNIVARLAGWQHLWVGFAPNEPFPLIEGRLQNLASQVGEVTAVMPGSAAAKAILEMMAGEPHPMPAPRELTEEEVAVQNMVVGCLGKCYGQALAAVGEVELSPLGIVSPVSRCSSHNYSEDFGEDENDGVTEAESDSGEEFEEEVEEFETEEEEVSSEEDADTHVSSPVAKPRPSFVPPHPPAMAGDEETESSAPTEEPEEPVIITAWAGLHLGTGANWAEHGLRPGTPEKTTVEAEVVPKSFVRPKLGRRGKDDNLWKDHDFVLASVVKPWVSDLGWRLTSRIGEAMWTNLISPAGEPLDVKSLTEPVARLEAELDKVNCGPLFAVTGHVEPTQHEAEAAERAAKAIEAAVAEAAEALVARADAEAEEAEATAEAGSEKDDGEAREPAGEDEEAHGEGEEEEEKVSEAEVEAEVEAESEVEQLEDAMVHAPLSTPPPGPVLETPPVPAIPSKIQVVAEVGHARAREFSSKLHASVQEFESHVSARGERDEESRLPPRWTLAARSIGNIDSMVPRDDLTKPYMPERSVSQPETTEDTYDVMTKKGACACPPSPAKGEVPKAPHLMSAKEVTPQPGFLRPMTRSGSFCGRLGQKAKLRPTATERPRSARARVRPRRTEVPWPSSEVVVHEVVATTIKRYLTRRCGSIEAGFAKLDKSGNGLIDREEWKTGLDRLGFLPPPNCDLQAVFTFLDKRRHHALMISDLVPATASQNYPIQESVRPRGLHSIASGLVQDVLHEQAASVVHEVLFEFLMEGLNEPRGRFGKMPDVKKWLKSRADAEKSKTKKGKKKVVRSDASDPEWTTSEESELVDDSKKTDKSDTKKKKKKLKKKKTKSLVDGGEDSETDDGGKKKKKKIDKSKSGLLRTTSSGILRSTSQGRLGKSQSEKLGRHASGKISSGGEDTDGNTKPDGKTKHQRPGWTSPTIIGGRQHSPGQDGNLLGRRPNGATGATKYGGKFHGHHGHSCGEEEADAINRERQLPWVPRPTEDICRAYGHVFRLLKDPRVRKNVPLGDKPTRREPVRVSVPRPATVDMQDSEYGDEEDLEGDRVMPLPYGMSHSTSKGFDKSKSSPNLTKYSVSTTAGSMSPARPGSEGSVSDLGDSGGMRSSTSLPSLKSGKSRSGGQAAPRRSSAGNKTSLNRSGGALGGVSGIDAEIRRGPASAIRAR